MITLRKKAILSGVSLALLFTVSPVSAQENSSFTYVVQNNKNVVGGIYKSVPNKKETLLVKSGKSNFNKQVLAAQTVGKSLVYEKVTGRENLRSYYCDSELYKVDILSMTKGKTTKIATEYVPPKPTENMKVVGSSLYYVKYENFKKDDSVFSVVKSDLTGKKKKILMKGIKDFWIRDKSIFVIKNDKLQKMNLDGKNLQVIKNLKYDLFPTQSWCAGKNYNVSENSLTVYDQLAEDRSEYKFMAYDFIKNKNTTLSFTFNIDKWNPLPESVNLEKKKMVIASSIPSTNYESKFNYNLYDFNGKKVKTLIKSVEKQNIIYTDMLKGRILYKDGQKLKMIKF